MEGAVGWKVSPDGRCVLMSSAWVRWPSALNVAAGIWLVASPFALNHATTAATVHDIVLGVVIFITSIWALSTFRGIPNWINSLLGIWLIIAPYAIGYRGRGEDFEATQNDIAVGALVLVMSVTATFLKAGSDRNWHRRTGDSSSYRPPPPP